MSKIHMHPSWKDVKPAGFYVYLHRRATDGRVFYVGKGSGKRAWESHETKRSVWWRRNGIKHGIIVEISQCGMLESESFLLESWLIAKMKHYGNELVNQNDGGGGMFGYVASESTKRKISQAKEKSPVECSLGLSFESISAAARYFSKTTHPKASASTIFACLSNKTESAYGASWWRSGDEPKPYTPRYDRTSASNGKVVIRGDGERYHSAQAAAYALIPDYPKCSPVNIGKVCRGERPTAYGYTWRYESS